MAKYTRLKCACYSVSITMAAICNLSPLLFLTFRSLYGISYSLLGLLVMINFCTQLGIDLMFSFFSHKFNISKAVKLTPVLSLIGILIYTLAPVLFPGAVYAGLVLGTVIFSAASGFAEVLISPVIAAIPAKDPDREMSKLHSVYAWGVVLVAVFTTFFIYLFSAANWQILAALFMIIPITSIILFSGCTIPQMSTPEKASGALKIFKNKNVLLCMFGIFLGGAAECTMAQWCSGYIEQALSLPKIWGDIAGMAMFSVMLGLGRTLYAKRGKNIYRVLTLGAAGAVVCYLIASLSLNPVVSLIACAFTGFCVSMLWPGTLIAIADKLPSAGVVVYALMAAGGDFGASVGPQLIGLITDGVIANASFVRLALSLSMTPDQLGMRFGMLIASAFPLIAVVIFSLVTKSKPDLETA